MEKLALPKRFLQLGLSVHNAPIAGRPCLIFEPACLLPSSLYVLIATANKTYHRVASCLTRQRLFCCRSGKDKDRVSSTYIRRARPSSAQSSSSHGDRSPPKIQTKVRVTSADDSEQKSYYYSETSPRCSPTSMNSGTWALQLERLLAASHISAVVAQKKQTSRKQTLLQTHPSTP